MNGQTVFLDSAKLHIDDLLLLPGIADSIEHLKKSGSPFFWVTQTADPTDTYTVFLKAGKPWYKSRCPYYKGFWLGGSTSAVECKVHNGLLPGMVWYGGCQKQFWRCIIYQETTKRRKQLHMPATVSVDNLSHLKNLLHKGAVFQILRHNKHPEFIGLMREVNIVQQNAVYTTIKDDPDHKFSNYNGGKGIRMDFEKASHYVFGDTVQVFDSPKKDRLMYEFEVINQQEVHL